MLGGSRTVRPLVVWRSAVMLSLSRWRSGSHRSLAAGGRAVRMGGTAAAGPRPRAVAVGLAVALVVLVVVGRLQQHLLAPSRPPQPGRWPWRRPPPSRSCRSRPGSGSGSTRTWSRWSPERGRSGRLVDVTLSASTQKPTGSRPGSRSPGRRPSTARGWCRGRTRCGSTPVNVRSGSMPGPAGSPAASGCRCRRPRRMGCGHAPQPARADRAA
jgi:hypothetical protein